MCNLPHYRFDRVRSICGQLQSYGFIKRSGVTETAVNWTPTDSFREWRALVAAGEATPSARKYFKQCNPKKPKIKLCTVCKTQFSTINYQQKICSAFCQDVKRWEGIKKRENNSFQLIQK